MPTNGTLGGNEGFSVLLVSGVRSRNRGAATLGEVTCWQLIGKSAWQRWLTWND